MPANGNARARLIRARTMIVNVQGDVGRATDLRSKLRIITDLISEILHDVKYIDDMPAVPNRAGL